MAVNLHLLTREQMLRKFVDEKWEEEKLMVLGPPKIDVDGRKKIHKRWKVGNVVFAWIRVHHNPDGPQTVVCFLRDGQDLYSYEEQYFEALA